MKELLLCDVAGRVLDGVSGRYYVIIISMEEQINKIKAWLGTGSINIFGLPMSGKDTVGVNLAAKLGASFLSSGDIVREMEKSTGQALTHGGKLIPQNVFYSWILPYFEREELKHVPLVLSSIGRWSGEESEVMSVARANGHQIQAVVELQLSERNVMERWEAAKLLNDRGMRADDADPEVFQTRIKEYREKTLPVIEHYRELGLLVPVPADFSREQVLTQVITSLADFAERSGDLSPKL